MDSLCAQNLVSNGDFEKVNICSEYNEACSPEAWRSTSKKLFGYNEGSKDNKFATLTLYNGRRAEDRKFIQTELLCPLQKEESYKVSFWLKGNAFSLHSLCVGFSDRFEYHDSWLEITGLEQECVSIEKLIQNDEWVKVELEYKAKGKEQFIIVGNLNKDEDTVYSVNDKKAYKKIKKSYVSQEFIQYRIDNIFVQSLSGEICKDYAMRVEHVKSQKHRHTNTWEPYHKSQIPDTPVSILIPEQVLPEEPTPVLQEQGQPVLEVRKIILRDLFFETDSYNLDLTDQKDLQDLIIEMRDDKKIRISIVGHTDQKGAADYNLNLSLQRANAVKAYLSQQGIDGARMHTDGKGEKDLISDKMDAKSLRKNRRVEIEVFY